MKKFLLLFYSILFICSSNINAQSPPCCPFTFPIEIIYPTPLTNGNIKIALETWTPTWGDKIYINHVINNNQIDIKGCYSGSILDGIDIYKDTISLTNLSPGLYTVTYKAYYYNQSSFPNSDCLSPIDSQMVDTTFIIGYMGINDLDIDSKINISPNPATDIQTLNIKTENNIDIEISIYDIQGRKIKTIYQSHVNAESINITSDITDLAPAMYFYLIEMGTERKYVRFIKE